MPSAEETIDSLLDALALRLAPKLAVQIAAAPADRLMTVRESAAYLGCSPQQVRNLVKANLLKTAKGFKDTRIKRSTLDAYGK